MRCHFVAVVFLLLSVVVQSGCVQNVCRQPPDISRVAEYMAQEILESRKDSDSGQAIGQATYEEERRIDQERLKRSESMRMAHLLRMSPAERDLVVRSWATLYWDEELRLKCVDVEKTVAISGLTAGATDRTFDELLRIARYSTNLADVNGALISLVQRRSIEMVPSFLAISEREDLPQDTRMNARRAAAFSVMPLSVWGIAELLEESELLDSASDRVDRNRLYAKIEEEIVEFKLEMPALIGRDLWCDNQTRLIRQSRGISPVTLAVQPFAGPKEDERMVVEALAKRLELLRPNGKRKEGTKDTN